MYREVLEKKSIEINSKLRRLARELNGPSAVREMLEKEFKESVLKKLPFPSIISLETRQSEEVIGENCDHFGIRLFRYSRRAA